MKNLSIVISTIVGIVVGYPLSYYFQGEFLRAKMTLGDYISKFPDVLGTIGKGNGDFGTTALITMAVCTIITQVILVLVMKKKQKD